MLYVFILFWAFWRSVFLSHQLQHQVSTRGFSREILHHSHMTRFIENEEVMGCLVWLAKTNLLFSHVIARIFVFCSYKYICFRSNWFHEHQRFWFSCKPATSSQLSEPRLLCCGQRSCFQVCCGVCVYHRSAVLLSWWPGDKRVLYRTAAAVQSAVCNLCGLPGSGRSTCQSVSELLSRV